MAISWYYSCLGLNLWSNIPCVTHEQWGKNVGNPKTKQKITNDMAFFLVGFVR